MESVLIVDDEKSLSSFLQLIAMEQQTCLLRVYSRKKDSKGLLYFKDGVLYDAVCRNKQGEQAGVEMIGWEDIEITFLPIPKNKIRRRVKGDLMSIILDAVRVSDESADKGNQVWEPLDNQETKTLEDDDEPVLELCDDGLTDYTDYQSLDKSEQQVDVTKDMRIFWQKKKTMDKVTVNAPAAPSTNGPENDRTVDGGEDVKDHPVLKEVQTVKGDKKEMSKLQEIQDYLMGEIDGFISCDVVDVESALSLAGACHDPNLDQSIPAAMFTDTFRSAMKGFDMVGWGVPTEILIPGKTAIALLIALDGGRYYQGIATSSKTPLGMIRAIFAKVKPEVEAALP